ncbi:hypothetical protein BDZ91DRAFT_724672 [Kalaharituber pfeilii]|nr:hypothetical protein BDZ91DRAFT_724672 [Kalaharituber pfeilii]
MYFLWGHSTIVIIKPITVAATAASLSERFDRFSYIGGIIRTSVSAAFFIVLALINAYIIYKLVKKLKATIKDEQDENMDDAFKVTGSGCFFQVFKGAFNSGPAMESVPTGRSM